MRIETLRLRDILAARQERRRERLRILEERIARVRRLHLAALDDSGTACQTIDLTAVVRDEHGCAAIRLQHLAEFQLQFPLQVMVKRRERLVEQQDLRIGREDARERRALLLAAREFHRIRVAELRQIKARQILPDALLPLLAIALCDKADVVGNRHIREKGKVLKEIADAPLLRGQVDALLAVKEHPAVEHDAPAVGALEPSDALEGHALAAA